MNTDIIEKLIKLNDETCPGFSYTNPLLDKNVTRAVSKSLVKTLYKSNQIGRKQNVRATLLQTIRNMCKTAPEGHVEIDEDLTEVLTSFYAKQMTKAASKNIDKQLDAFLIRKSKFTNINTRYESNVNPEVVQALLNLKENIVFSEEIDKEIIHWNLKDQKAETVLQNLWSEDINHGTTFYDSISIKLKSKLENVLLIHLHKILENQISDTGSLFIDSELASLVKSCALSAECFQICTSILNSIFITTNFNNFVHKFVVSFVQNVKLESKTPLSVLYPVNLSNMVTILDVNLDDLPHSLKERYVKLGKDNLKTIHNNSENCLIMLLSHFPVWFNIYFDT